MTKQIIGYDNYIIDENGNVFNTITNKYLSGSISEQGYRYYRLSKNNKKKMVYAHRLVAETFLDNPNNLPVVNHIDGNKINNNVTNLKWASYSDNAKHAYNTGLIANCRNRNYYIGDLDNEVWKPLFSLPYSISSQGRVRNNRTNLLLKPSLTCGYYKVRPSVDGQPHDIMIHNAMYCVFNDMSSIPEGMVVDHIDGDKTNNSLDNLRLITLSENVKAAYYETKTNSNRKTIDQFSKEGKYIATYPSAREAARILNLDSSTIIKVCRGKNKSHGGYIFKYKN